jgi:glycosyltransferase involved in cell wall biosynthesis
MVGTRLAIVNWRDPWHPAAGGAERYAWELARRYAAKGSPVTYLTCRAPGQTRRDHVDGVDIVRRGGTFTVYPLILAWMLAHRRSFDAVVDCQNGIPFFTPWVLPKRVPVICVVHHVHDKQFALYFPPWLARIGQFLEGPVFRLAYRGHACVAVSQSTAAALRGRLRWSGPVHVIPNGLSLRSFTTPFSAPVASPHHPPARAGVQLVCVARLVPHKQLGHILDLADRLRIPVHIIGRGPEANALAESVRQRGLSDIVVLHGYLPEEEKTALIAQSVLHISASQGEGWGLSVTEAAALGVPSVAYDVEGLRDAIKDGVTGWLVPATATLDDTVERAVKELSDPDRRAEVAQECRRWAAEFDWMTTADLMQEVLVAAIKDRRARQ